MNSFWVFCFALFCCFAPNIAIYDHLPFPQPVLSSEHMAAFGVFGLCQIHAFVDYLRNKLNPQQFEVLFRSVISLVGFVLLTVGALLMLTGRGFFYFTFYFKL